MKAVKWTGLLLWLCAAAAPLWAQRVFSVAIGYDSLGRIESLVHPGTGMEQSYTFAESGGHKRVYYGGGQVVTGTNYTAGSAPSSVSVAAYDSLSAASITRDYDNLNRLRSLKVTMGGTRYHAHSISYNNWGFVQGFSRADSGLTSSISYGYGNYGELTSFSMGSGRSASYQYDTRGNMETRDGFADSTFALPDLAPTSYGQDNQRTVWDYDADGKLTGDDDFDYEYNDLERVCEVDGLDGRAVAQYLYDAMGERVREVVEDRVVYSIRGPGGLLLSQEIHQTRIDGTMAVTQKDYVYHNGQVLLTVTRHPDSSVTRQYQYRDRQGHPVYVLDEDEGYLDPYRDYSPYGIQMRLLGGEAPTHVFTGHERDEATGWDYMHQRYCTSVYARFNRPDPAYNFDPANPFSYNLYGYTWGNPVNAWDPFGLETVGEWLEARIMDHAGKGNDVRGYLYTVVKVGWDVFGTESVSRVVDDGVRGEEITAEELFWAGLDIATMGKGSAPAKGVRAAVHTGLHQGDEAVNLGRKLLSGGKAAPKAGPKLLPAISQTTLTRMAAEAGQKGLKLSRHAMERLIGRESHVTLSMVKKAIEKGKKYFDPKNGAISYILDGGLASGKTLLVGQNPKTGLITTIITGNRKKVFRPRFQPID